MRRLISKSIAVCVVVVMVLPTKVLGVDHFVVEGGDVFELCGCFLMLVTNVLWLLRWHLNKIDILLGC